MDFELSDRTKDFQERLLTFMDEKIYPAEDVYEEPGARHVSAHQPLRGAGAARPPTVTGATESRA